MPLESTSGGEGSTPAASTHPKTRKPRRRKIIPTPPVVTSTPTTSARPVAGTVIGYTAGREASYPEPAWGPTYYKPRPGLLRTLTQLRSAIGDDRSTSYILGDLLEARYENQNDFRYNYFQKQADEYQHQLNLADIAAQNGEEYELPEVDIDGLPAGDRPRSLLREMMEQLSGATNDGARDAIAQIYKKRIEDAYDIQNDIREQRGRIDNYERDFLNTQDERALRENYREDKEGNELPPWYLPPASWSPEQREAKAADAVSDSVSGALSGMFGGLLKSNGSEGDDPAPGWLHKLTSNIPGTVTSLTENINDGDNPVNNFLKKVEDETEDPLWWTLDKLSRPLYGVNRGLDATFAADEEKGHGPGRYFAMAPIAGLAGQNPLESLDDIIEEPSKALDIFKAAAKGVYSGGLGNSDDPMFFGEVIANQAERDPAKNMYDSKNWQLWAGLGGDLIMDPLNYVGLGLVKQPTSLATRGVQASIAENVNTLRVERNAERIAKYIDETEHGIIGPEEPKLNASQITEMLLGRSAHRPRSEAERISFLAENERAAQRLENYLETRRPVGNLQKHEVEKVKQTLRQERQRVLNKFAQDTYLTELERMLDVKVARGELPRSDFDEILSTAQVYKIIDDAMRHEDWLDNVAKTYFKDFDNWNAVEAHYESLVQRFKEGKISQKQVDDFRDKIDYAISPRIHDDGSVQSLPYDDINDLLGTRWKSDFRMGSDETRKVLRQAMQMAKGVTRDSNDAMRSVVAKRKQTYKNRRAAQQKGWDTSNYDSNIRRQDRAIQGYEDQIRQQTADLFVRMLKSHLLTREGKTVYGDAGKVDALKRMLAEVETRLSKETPDANQNVATSADRAFDADDLGERNVDYVYKGKYNTTDITAKGKSVKGEGYTDEWQPDFSALENNVENFQSYRQQLEFMRDRINEQIQHLEFNPETGRNVMEPEANLVRETPAAMLNEDGTVNKDHLMRAVKVDRWGNLETKPTGDPEIDEWINQVARVFHQKYMVDNRKIYNSQVRRINEGIQAKNEQKQLEELSPQGKIIAKMFVHEGDKFKLPKIELNGQSVTGADSETLAELVTVQDRQRVDALKRILREVNSGDVSRHQAIGRLRDYLRSIGKSVPDSPKSLTKWLTDERVDSLLTEISENQVAFQRLFNKQHGMTVGQALVERDYLLGKTVRGVGPWARRFPRGITRRDYKTLAQNSVEDLLYVTEKGPLGRFTNVGGTTEKQARTGALSTGDRAKSSREWAERTYQRLMSMPPGPRSRYLDQQFDKALKKQGTLKDQINEGLLVKYSKESQKVELSKDQYRQIHEQALKNSYDYVEDQINANRLQLPAGNTELKLAPGLDSNTGIDYINKVIKYRFGAERADLFTQKYLANRAKDTEQLREIEGRLAQVDRQEAQWATEHQKLVTEANNAKAEMVKRLREDAVIRTAALSKASTKTKLGLNILGRVVAVPGSDKLFRATDRFSGLPVIKETRQLFADAFGSPAASLSEEELREARAIALAQAPIIIEHKIRRLQNTIGRFHEADRVKGFKNMLKGTDVDGEIKQAIKDAFDENLLAAFQGQVKVGDGADPTSTLSLAEINRYLPRELKMSDKQLTRGVDTRTVNSIVRAMQAGKPKNLRIKDPYRMAWVMNVAVEQAKARKAVQHVVKNAFGVRKVGVDDPAFQALRELPKMGWKEVSDLGNTHLFPPQITDSIEQLFKMLEPRELSDFGRLADRVTGYWKTITTVYNPGYWTRNGVGEVMSSWFAGVNNPMVYKKSANVMKYWRNDGKDLEALSEQFPWLKHSEGRAPKDSDTVLHTADGYKLTYEDIVVLYNDNSLKTGFFNTEFDAHYSKAGNKIRENTGVGNKNLGDVHQGFRSAGEWYEDYLRMAHFIHALEKNRGTLTQAAKKAAQEVRKYHFDYTDFTNFEKMVMLRAFPFYKWTRKALPLMLTMLFTKPGKVMAYPKIMNTVSNSISTGDIAQDKNGFAPDYEGIVPSWIQDLWAYQIGEHGDEDQFGQQNETYFNLNTPQFDSYKALTNPGNTAYGLLNPLMKVPDQVLNNQTGHSIGELVGQEPFVDEGLGGLLSAFAKDVPQGNWLQKVINDKAYPEDNATFGTGLGFYRSNEDRRLGELINQGKIK